jgi:spore coat polysaccharide biosynthesis protein SpsF
MTTASAIILQARMASTRLPGKALANLGGRPLVARCVERLAARSSLPVILATTIRAEDDVLAEEGRSLGIPVIRGAVDDVLGRFVQVATSLGLLDCVRATADNPAVDPDAPRRVLDLRRRAGADHVVEHGLPYGAAVEAISTAALVRAAALTSDANDREHVTAFIRRDPRFFALAAIAPAEVRRPDVRLTVDTAEDLERMRLLYALAGPLTPPPSLATMIAAFDRAETARGPRAPEVTAR